MTAATDLDNRTYFHTLDGAMADFDLALAAVDKVRDTVRGLDYEHVYIPATREFIALEAPGADAPVAYITDAFVALHPRGGSSSFVEMPQRARAAGESASEAPERASARRQTKASAKAAEPVAALCPTCFVGLPATGRCDFCD